MDPLTALLAAAAATGPNTLQSQALTALRSAGPQESFFTRMGNPHPLQMQQLAQPTTPQINPIITQPTMAPTALTQPLPMPIMPLASPLADPTSNARASHPHVAGHPQDAATGQPSTSYDANNAADSGHTATGNDAKRPRRSTPRPIFLHSPQGRGRFGRAGDAGPASTAQQCTQRSTTRRADNGRAPAQSMGSGHTQPASTTSRPLEAGQDTQLRPPSRSRTRPQHRRHGRSRSHRRDRRSRSHLRIGTDPGPLVQIPKPAQP